MSDPYRTLYPQYITPDGIHDMLGENQMNVLRERISEDPALLADFEFLLARALAIKDLASVTIEAGPDTLAAVLLSGEDPRDTLDEITSRLIADHPLYRAFKEPDDMPEGIFVDDAGLFVQRCCRCQDGSIRALRRRVIRNDEHRHLPFEEQELSDEYYPF